MGTDPRVSVRLLPRAPHPTHRRLRRRVRACIYMLTNTNGACRERYRYLESTRTVDRADTRASGAHTNYKYYQ